MVSECVQAVLCASNLPLPLSTQSNFHALKRKSAGFLSVSGTRKAKARAKFTWLRGQWHGLCIDHSGFEQGARWKIWPYGTGYFYLRATGNYL